MNQNFFNQNKGIFGNQSQQPGINTTGTGLFNQTQPTSGVFGGGMTGSKI